MFAALDPPTRGHVDIPGLDFCLGHADVPGLQRPAPAPRLGSAEELALVPCVSGELAS